MMQASTPASHVTGMAGTCVGSNPFAAPEIAVTRFAVFFAWAGRAGLRRVGALLLVMFLLVFLPNGAKAAGCAFTGGTTTSAVTFNPPSTITIPFNAAVGTIIYTSPLVPPAIAPQITCTGTTNYGVKNVGVTPGIGVSVFPTSISGLGYSITHNDLVTYLFPYPCCQLAAGSYNASISSSLQLIKTGPIVSGSTLPVGLLGSWNFDPGINVETFTLGNTVTILDPACSVNTTPINVALPTVNSSSMAANGATAGSTPFAIALTCSSGATLDVQLDFAGVASGIPGVLTKTGGTSAGVSVQLIDKSFNPVIFGTKTLVGATPTGLLSIQYYARYYRIAAITAGTLTASATFTLSYQ